MKYVFGEVVSAYSDMSFVAQVKVPLRDGSFIDLEVAERVHDPLAIGDNVVLREVVAYELIVESE